MKVFDNKHSLMKGVILSTILAVGLWSSFGCSKQSETSSQTPATPQTASYPASSKAQSANNTQIAPSVTPGEAQTPSPHGVAPAQASPSATPAVVTKPDISKIRLHPTNLKGDPLVINGFKISATDFKRKLFKAKFVQSAQGLDYSGTNSNELYGKLKTHVLQELIRETVIDQQAAANGVSIPDAQVDEVMAGIKSRFPSQEAFLTTMRSRGLTEETMRAYNKLQLVSVALLNKLGGQAQFDELINSKIATANIDIDVDLVDKLTFEIMQEHQETTVN